MTWAIGEQVVRTFEERGVALVNAENPTPVHGSVGTDWACPPSNGRTSPKRPPKLMKPKPLKKPVA